MPTGYPGVTISGVPALGSAPALWTLVPGTVAPVYEFHVQPGDADTVLKGEARPFDLVIDADPKVTVRNVISISRGVSSDPNLAAIRVTDRRFAWPYIHIGPRRYNVRRKIGNKRLENAQSVKEIAQLTDLIRYHPNSLNNGATWTAVGILQDILETIAAKEDIFGRGKVSVKIDLPNVGRLPVENLEIDDSADKALDRVLGYLPGAAITVDLDGSIRVYSQIDGSEIGYLESFGAESVGGGHVQVIDNSRIRPRDIVVKFDREIEVRADYDETGTFDANHCYLENVLDVPDYELDLGQPYGIVPTGTWASFGAALAAWNQTPLQYIGAISTDTIQKAMVPYMDFWSAAQLAGSFDPDADWTGRFASILRNYRQTFRLSKTWTDSIRQMGAYRVATTDSATATRAPSLWFGDYSYLASQRTGILKRQAGGVVPYAINVTGYPQSGLIDESTRPAPADVSLLDADQGIFRVQFKPDLLRVYEAVLPSQIETDGDNTQPGTVAANPGPNEDYAAGLTDPVTFDSIRPGGRVPRLTKDYRGSLIFTAIPAYPNSEDQLHSIRVMPKDVEKAMPDAFKSQLENCHGPTLEIRIGPNIETARIPWLDANRETIYEAFGIGPPLDKGFGTLSERLSSIVLNDSPADDERSAASLRNIAKAAAAAAWAAYADHAEGGKTVPISGDLKLTGFMGSATIGVQPDGQAIVTLHSSGPRRPLSMFAYLDSNTRKFVMRLAR